MDDAQRIWVGRTSGILWHSVGEAELMDGMRTGDEGAYAEFFRRYTPLVFTLARRQNSDAGDAMEFANEFLDDLALKIGRSPFVAPQALTGYLATSFRRYLAMQWRSRSRRVASRERLSSEAGGGLERAVAEGCSGYVLKLAAGGDPDDAIVQDSHARDVRLRLVEMLLTQVTEEERRVLGFLCDRYPQREIAAFPEKRVEIFSLHVFLLVHGPR